MSRRKVPTSRNVIAAEESASRSGSIHSTRTFVEESFHVHEDVREGGQLLAVLEQLRQVVGDALSGRVVVVRHDSEVRRRLNVDGLSRRGPLLWSASKKCEARARVVCRVAESRARVRPIAPVRGHGRTI